MSNIYFDRLDEESKEFYIDKLEYNGISLPDPLDSDLRLQLYKPLTQNNSPDLTFGDIYIFLVETAKIYSRVEFKNFKALSCYKTASSPKIRDILAYKCTNSDMCVLTCDVQSDESISLFYRPWIVVSLNGVIQNGHCTCMTEFTLGCQHIASLLLSVDMVDKNSVDSSCETSSDKDTWLSLTKFLGDKSTEKKSSSLKENSSMNTSLPSDNKEKLQVIKRIVPHAPIFTLLCDSDISSSDEMESENEYIEIHELLNQ